MTKRTRADATAGRPVARQTIGELGFADGKPSQPEDGPTSIADGRPSEAAGGPIGFVGGVPVARELLDRRIAGLRGGPLRAALPVPGSAEDRQLARWVTQVILTEALCEAEAARLGLEPVGGGPLDRLAAVELGSITASAYDGSPWVRAVFEHVTATVTVPPSWRPGRATPALAAARRLAFARWLDEKRAADVRLVSGLEHPGDPRQPDNHHKH